ncbi:hypothetical protein EZS27_008958 [termite gut metagenome]|uniref:Uncharacterized protein n=1 Tax=termite gut metagenome TaxID=433724 RepID=A0A5J4SBH1_9ZZZZ
MKKIIILTGEPLTMYTERILCINEFIKEGFNVEYWDCSQYFYLGLSLSDSVLRDYIFKIKTLHDLRDAFSIINIQDAIFILGAAMRWKYQTFFKLLSQKQCVFIKIDYYANTSIKIPLKEQIKIIFSSRFLELLKREMMNITFSYYNKYINGFKYMYYLTSSSIVTSTHKINHPDYEEYQEYIKAQTLTPHMRYIIFSDIYFPFHPDLKYFLAYRVFSNPKEYWKTLTNFFDYLENRFNMPVIIAAHPKSEYKGNEFGNREIVKYKSCELIANSQFVVTHTSNSISFAVLANKPTIFITTNGIKQYKGFNSHLYSLAKFFQKCVYNIDKINYDSISISEIPFNIREKYIYDYLTSKEIQNQSNQQILCNLFKGI